MKLTSKYLAQDDYKQYPLEISKEKIKSHFQKNHSMTHLGAGTKHTCYCFMVGSIIELGTISALKMIYPTFMNPDHVFKCLNIYDDNHEG